MTAQEIEITEEMWLYFRQEKSIETRNTILMHYIHLVKEIGRRLAPVYQNFIEFDDLVSNGVLGLMEAIEKFDPSRGIKFETYATWRIKGEMIDQIRKQDWLPKSLRQKIKRIEEAYRNYEKLTGRYPSDEEVAKALGMDVAEVQKTLNDSYTYQVVSMDEQIMDILKTDGDILAGPDTPEHLYMEGELKETMVKALGSLTENERMAITLFYFEELNQKEIGKVMGLTESRISQLHSKALMKLRTTLHTLYPQQN